MKALLLRFLGWLSKLLSGLLAKKADEQDSKEDSKKIDESDNSITDKPVDPKDRKDEDVFNNKGW
jgi:hypothetical protein